MFNSLLKTKDQVEAEGAINTPPYSFFSKAMLELNEEQDVLTPHSDVYFVRYALYVRTGWWFPLTNVEEAMRAEGWNKMKQRKKKTKKT